MYEEIIYLYANQEIATISYYDKDSNYNSTLHFYFSSGRSKEWVLDIMGYC
jgi:hypothetical protein